MSRQEQFRDAYARLTPTWRRSLELYRDQIDHLVTPTSRLLDVGCGHGTLLKDVYAKTPHCYGLEPDAAALAKNTLIPHKAVGFVEHMPFEDNFFDVIVLEWVLEHLDNPVESFREIHRVLKPGGHVVFITPNAWNYNTWLIRAVPNRFHAFFTKRLYGRPDGDTYPVRYRINAAKTMDRVLGSVGFVRSSLILNGDPTYISFGPVTFWIARQIERVLDWKPLNWMRVHLIGTYQKE